MAEEWKRLGELAAAATRGPWEDRYEEHRTFGEETKIWSGTKPVIGTAYHDGLHLLIRERDSSFIAAANPDAITRLLAERDALESRVRQLEGREG